MSVSLSPPLAPPPLAPEDNERARSAERRARAACGPGSMSDIVVPAFLTAEVQRFFDDDPESSGIISLSRVHSALEVLPTALVGPSRMPKTRLRTVWGLLQQEMKFAVGYNKASEVKPLRKMFNSINKGAYNTEQGQWDMGFVRESLAKGWPQEQALPVKLGASVLGPLQWWYTSWVLSGDSPPTRQDIYDCALRSFQKALQRHVQAEQSPRPDETGAGASGSNRPVRRAASAAIAASRAVKVKDDTSDPTYNPAEDEPKTDAKKSNAQPAVADTTPTTTVPAPSNATSRKARPLPSPWLPPSGFSAELKWQVANYNQHHAQTVQWPEGQHIPDAQLWEHPSMHGCPVDKDTGQAVQFEVACTTCQKHKRNCIWRGSKACLPCFWEKGSNGPCKGGTPPTKTQEEQKFCKPDYARRKAYLDDLVSKGKIQYPLHFVDETGRARRGSTSGTTGRAPTHEPLAPDAKLPALEQGGSSSAPTSLAASRDTVTSNPPETATGSSDNARRPLSPVVETGESATSVTKPAIGPSLSSPSGDKALAVAGVIVSATPNASKSQSPSVALAGGDAPKTPEGALSGRETIDESQQEDQMTGIVPSGASVALANGHLPDAENEGREQERRDVEMTELSDTQPVANKRRREDETNETTALASITNDVHPPKRPRRGTARASDNENAPDSGREPSIARESEPDCVPTGMAPRPSGSRLTSELADDRSASATSRSASHAPAPGQDRGKGRTKSKISGSEQRRTAPGPVKIRTAIPGTRSIPRAGSPSEFPPYRPAPCKQDDHLHETAIDFLNSVIPDENMEFSGDHAGIVRVPQPVLNVAGDVVFVNIVERAVRQELRDGLRDLRDDLRDDRVLQREDRQYQREMMKTIEAMEERAKGAGAVSSGLGPTKKDAQNPANDHLSGDGATSASMSLHELATMLTTLNLKLDSKLDPLSTRVQSLDDKLNPLAANVASLSTNYDALLTRMDRVESQMITAVDETPRQRSALSPDPNVFKSGILVDEPPSPPNASGDMLRVPTGGQTPAPVVAGDNTGARTGVQISSPIPLGEMTRAIHSPVAVPAGNTILRAVTNAAAPSQAPPTHPTGDLGCSAPGPEPTHPSIAAPAPLARTTPFSIVGDGHLFAVPPRLESKPHQGAPPGEEALGKLTAQSLSRAAISTAGPPASVQGPSSAPSPPNDYLESRSAATSSLSPLTESTSGNYEEQPPAEDDPMETGDNWAPITGKRGVDDAAIRDEERAAKRHAGDSGSDADLDAEGSVDESEPAPQVPAEIEAPRGNARGKGRGGPRSRRAGTRNRPMPRSG
ncbi:unnamed protein product [Peniophora sp. CBMAI 1063]|nr:unnamed protein product [Peniophora sp. CBMAI 1063]